MKTIINNFINICICTIILTSCCGVQKCITQDDIFKSFYFNKLRYPFSLEEVLSMYHDGVYYKLYCETGDSSLVDSIMVEKLTINNSPHVSEGIAYYNFYKMLKSDKEFLQYNIKHSHIELINTQNKTKYLIPKYDLIKEVNYENSYRYHNIKLNSYFYDNIDDTDNPIVLDEASMSLWGEMVDNTSFFCCQCKCCSCQSKHNIKNYECMMVEYCYGELYIIDPKFKYKKYKWYLDKTLPVVKDFIITRNNIKRITFPILVEK